MCIRDSLAPMLRKLGAQVDVIDFPAQSNTADLNATIKAANEGGYDFGISLHCDSSDNVQDVYKRQHQHKKPSEIR